jgi:hypothetical protein
MLNIVFWNVHGLPDHKLDDDVIRIPPEFRPHVLSFFELITNGDE